MILRGLLLRSVGLFLINFGPVILQRNHQYILLGKVLKKENFLIRGLLM